jgi:hypothetical protein
MKEIPDQREYHDYYTVCVSSDQDDINWVLGKILEFAKAKFKVMYLIRKDGFYYMTEYPPELKVKIATVFPGGRILVRDSML